MLRGRVTIASGERGEQREEGEKEEECPLTTVVGPPFQPVTFFAYIITERDREIRDAPERKQAM
jgi:hypothetical protein